MRVISNRYQKLLWWVQVHLLSIALFYTVNMSENLDRASVQCKTWCVRKMITCLTCSLPGVVLSTKTREFKVFFHVFEQHRYGMNASLSLNANTRIIFGCSAIFFLPLLFRLVSINRYCLCSIVVDLYFILLSVNSHAFDLCYICYVTCG